MLQSKKKDIWEVSGHLLCYEAGGALKENGSIAVILRERKAQKKRRTEDSGSGTEETYQAA
jgi:hypothetical protein